VCVRAVYQHEQARNIQQERKVGLFISMSRGVIYKRRQNRDPLLQCVVRSVGEISGSISIVCVYDRAIYQHERGHNIQQETEQGPFYNVSSESWVKGQAE